MQRGEPLRAEACRAGGLWPGPSLHPEGLPARSSGLRPGTRLSAQQTLSLGSWAESPPLASSVYPEAGSGTLVHVSLSAPHTLQARGDFMQEAAPGVPGELQQQLEAGPASGLTPLWAWSGCYLALG